MKNIALIIVSAILGVLTWMMVMTIEGRSNRSMELKMNLASASEETLENMSKDTKYSINNSEEFLSDFIQSLSETIDSDIDLRVDVMNVDKEKEILSFKVIGEFQHPNGNKGTVQDERTVLFNQTQEQKKQTCVVSFFLTNVIGETECYKTYEVQPQEIIRSPVDPIEEGKTFAGWVDSNGYLADFSVPVTQDQTYYASWN